MIGFWLVRVWVRIALGLRVLWGYGPRDVGVIGLGISEVGLMAVLSSRIKITQKDNIKIK